MTLFKFLIGVAILVSTVAVAEAQDYLQTVITDGTQGSAEGRLDGYSLQDDGVELCSDPYVIGMYVSCSPALRIAGRTYTAPARKVWVETNGQVGGMRVVDRSGRVRCIGPVSSNDFRGMGSFLYCP